MAPVSTSTITPPPLTLTLLHPSWKGHLTTSRSEEHTSELQSRPHLVCRLLLEKKTENDDERDRRISRQERQPSPGGGAQAFDRRRSRQPWRTGQSPSRRSGQDRPVDQRDRVLN